MDRTFQGEWRPLKLPFFTVEGEPPEHASPLMRTIFTRHLPAVEAALREEPTNEGLWALWAWMARSVGNRPWPALLRSLDPFIYPDGPACPASRVAPWLVKEGAARKEWALVADLAKVAAWVTTDETERVEHWSPSAVTIKSNLKSLDGYPLTSAYLPGIEANLRLGRIQEAERLFREARASLGPECVPAMVRLARQCGQPSCAQAWQADQGSDGPVAKGIPVVYASGVPDGDVMPLMLAFRSLKIPCQCGSGRREWNWPKNEPRWALVDASGQLVKEGQGRPDPGTIQAELDRLGFRTTRERAKAFLLERPGHLEAIRVLAMEATSDGIEAMGGDDQGPELDESRDEALFGEAAWAWGKLFEGACAWRTPLLWEGPWARFARWPGTAARRSPRMRSVAERALPRVEAALQEQPGSADLWSMWLRWRLIAGDARPISVLVATLEPSPLTAPGLFPPSTAMSALLKDCQQAGRWGEAAKILKVPWERALEAANGKAKRTNDTGPSASDWNTGRLLVEALLQDGRGDDAHQVVQAWIACGGRIPDGQAILGLAERLGRLDVKGWVELQER